MQFLSLLATLAATANVFVLAQDLGALMNANLSIQCLLAINARTQTIGCMSPYDLATYQNPPANMLYALIVQSFSFMPTFCGGQCSLALNQFSNDVSAVCGNEILLSPALSKEYLPLVIGATVGAPPNVTGLNATAQQAAGAAYLAAIAPIEAYFNNFTTYNTINLVKGIRNVMCVKNSPNQADAANLLDNKYCLTSQYGSLVTNNISLTDATALKSVLMSDPCEVCLQYEAAQIVNSYSLIPLLQFFNSTITLFGELQAFKCTNLTPVMLINSSVQSGFQSFIIGGIALLSISLYF